MANGIAQFFALTVGPDATQVGDILHIGSSLQNHNNHGIGVGTKIALKNETRQGHTWATAVMMARGNGAVGVTNSGEKQLQPPEGSKPQGVKTLLFDGTVEYMELLVDSDLRAVITVYDGSTTFLTDLQPGQEIAIIETGGDLGSVFENGIVRSVTSNSSFVCEYGPITDWNGVTGGLAISTKIPAASFAIVNPGLGIQSASGAWEVHNQNFVWIPNVADSLNYSPGASEGMGGVLLASTYVDKTKAMTAAYGWADAGSGGGVFTPSIANITDGAQLAHAPSPFTLPMQDGDNAFHMGYVGPTTAGAYSAKIISWHWGQTISKKALPIYSRLFTSQTSGLASSIFSAAARGSGYHARFLQNAPDAYLTAYFTFIRQTQLHHGNDKPLILVAIESGPHTLDDTGDSVGPAGPLASNTIAGEQDNVRAILNRIIAIWVLNGWDLTELFFLLWVPADVGTSSTQYALVRAGQRDVADDYDRCDAMDLTADRVELNDLLTLAPLNDGVHYVSDTFNDYMMSRVIRHYIDRVNREAEGIPETCTCSITARDGSGQAEAGIVFAFRKLEAGDTAGTGYRGEEETETSDEIGLVEKVLVRGAIYEVRRANGQWKRFTVDDDEAMDLGPVVSGRE
jgi:hypothetical protein